jgi:DNA replication and repair protein RecF
MPLKKTGSQGQIKSFLIALKLAMYNFIYEMPRGSLAELLPIKKGIPFDIDLKNKHEITNEKRNVKPLLLLDDIFEKIDTSRMQQLVEIISKPEMGQVIITDTNKKRVEEYFEGRGEVGFFEL